MEDGVTLSGKEVERLRVLVAVSAGELSRATAALQLGVSVRQLKRLLRRYRQEGPAGLRSRRRGRASNRRLANEVRGRVIALARSRYSGFGPTLLQEKLLAAHDIELAVETVRMLLLEAGLWRVKRRRREVHPLRERRLQFGELIQIDGSLHDWLEGRAERCTLLAFIDDASGRVTAARFMPAETTAGYFAVLSEHLHRYGRPISLYSDRHSIFVLNDRQGRKIQGRTQLARALDMLDIESICAYSPQAKGRIERLFQTCQDRLVKEMRLLGIDSLTSANAFLPQFMTFFNDRFAVTPRRPEDAHRPLLHSPRALELILAEHTDRTVSKNLSCQYRGRLYQMLADDRRRRLTGQRITVCERSNGEVVLLAGNEELAYSVGPQPRPPVAVADDKTLNAHVDAAIARRSPPPPSHPWRRAFKPSRIAAS